MHPCKLSICGRQRSADLSPWITRLGQGRALTSCKIPVLGTKAPRRSATYSFAVVFIAARLLLPWSPANLEARAEAPPQGRTRAPLSNLNIESSPQLFATMCAVHAAGFDKDVSAVGFHPVRARLRGELLRLQGPATEALRQYYREHDLPDSAATLSRYVSFALVVGPPPKFTYRLSHDDLPPDVLTIEGFNEVLANFYREAQIDRLWRQVQAEYEREIERLHEPVTQLVLTSTAYLRELLKPTSPRTFVVYVEPMVGGKINFRNFGNEYAIVLNPGSDLPMEEIRHALLHFHLDPLAMRYKGVVALRKPLLNFAVRAPRLPVEYKDDFPALLTECLVRAAELRLHRLSAEKLAAAINEAEGDGYVLVRPFIRALAKFEKAEPAMSFYFPDLVRGIDVAEETRRLQTVVFAAALAPAAEVPVADATQAATSSGDDAELTAWLSEGEREIAAKNGVAAAAAFDRALAKYPDHRRALYGRAVAAVLQGEAELAKALFERLVVNPPGADGSRPGLPPGAKDPLILAWSHVYLGRIHDVDGNRELAVSEYRAALAVEGAPESARLAARRGIEKGYERAQERP